MSAAVAEQRKRITLHEGILQGPNSLNFIRLVLASMVIYAHAIILNLYKQDIPTDWWWTQTAFVGSYAVNMFFCISGFLIAHSATRGNALGFVKRRFLRIFPGLWAALLFIIIVGGTLTAALGLSGAWSITDAFKFFTKNAILYRQQFDLFGGPTGQPMAGVWLGTTWTLRFEFTAYLLLIPIFYISMVKKRAKIVVPVMYALLVAWSIAYAMGKAQIGISALKMDPNQMTRMFTMFFAGAVLYVFKDKIKVYPAVSLLLLASTFVIQKFAEDNGHVYSSIASLIFAYAILSLGSFMKVSLGQKNDISYGVYVYGWTVQVILLVLGSYSLGIYINTLLTYIFTFALAWLSWKYVEKPAMSLKDKKIFPSLSRSAKS